MEYLTPGAVALRLGTAYWRVGRFLAGGEYDRVVRAGRVRLIAEDDLGHLADALRRAGHLPASEAQPTRRRAKLATAK